MSRCYTMHCRRSNLERRLVPTLECRPIPDTPSPANPAYHLPPTPPLATPSFPPAFLPSHSTAGRWLTCSWRPSCRGDRSPYFLLAQAVAHLEWSCAAKRLVFTGVLRVAVDVAQLAFVDAFNKFRRRDDGLQAGLLATNTRDSFSPLETSPRVEPRNNQQP